MIHYDNPWYRDINTGVCDKMHCNVSEGAITIYLVILEHGVVAVLRWLCINSHGDCLI